MSRHIQLHDSRSAHRLNPNPEQSGTSAASVFSVFEWCFVPFQSPLVEQQMVPRPTARYSIVIIKRSSRRCFSGSPNASRKHTTASALVFSGLASPPRLPATSLRAHLASSKKKPTSLPSTAASLPFGALLHCWLRPLRTFAMYGCRLLVDYNSRGPINPLRRNNAISLWLCSRGSRLLLACHSVAPRRVPCSFDRSRQGISLHQC